GWWIWVRKGVTMAAASLPKAHLNRWHAKGTARTPPGFWESFWPSAAAPADDASPDDREAGNRGSRRSHKSAVARALIDKEPHRRSRLVIPVEFPPVIPAQAGIQLKMHPGKAGIRFHAGPRPSPG